MAYYDAFIAKWAQAPAGTTASKLTWVNAQTATGPALPMVIPTYEIFNLIDPTEFNALSSPNQQLVRDILGMGTVNCSPGTLIRSRIIGMFPNGTTTFTNLSNLAKKYDSPTIPWWQANGYARPFDMGDVAAAGVS